MNNPTPSLASYRSSMDTRSPPPPYTATQLPYHNHTYPSEATPLIVNPLHPKVEPGRTRSLLGSAYHPFAVAFVFIFVVIFILQNLLLVPCLLDGDSISIKRAMRHQWQEEQKAHDALARQWVSDRVAYQRETRLWESKRAEWHQEQLEWEEERYERQREQKRWDEERKEQGKVREEVERMRQGAYWHQPAGDTHCTAYKKRSYRATVNALGMCTNMPVEVDGRRYESPDECYRDKNGDAVGVWSVTSDDPFCIPMWGPLEDKGCAPGKSNMGRYEARLDGVQHGDRWETMCETTPITINGHFYEHPTSCENRGWWYGMVGIWDVPRETCPSLLPDSVDSGLA